MTLDRVSHFFVFFSPKRTKGLIDVSGEVGRKQKIKRDSCSLSPSPLFSGPASSTALRLVSWPRAVCFAQATKHFLAPNRDFVFYANCSVGLLA